VVRLVHGVYANGATNGRVMVLNVHPWIMGQPWRIGYLDQVLGHIDAHQGVWKATGGQVIDWFKKQSLALFVPLYGVPFGIKEQFFLEGPTLGEWKDPSPDIAPYTATVVTPSRECDRSPSGACYGLVTTGHVV
jgi:hypothetical protein